MDIFSLSVEDMNDGHIKLIPINNLPRERKHTMAVHVASHLHRLVKILNKKNLPMGKINKKKYISEKHLFRWAEKGPHLELWKRGCSKGL